MDPLQILQERGGVTGAFIENAGKLIAQGGRTHESVFLELGMSADDARSFFAEYYQVPAFKTPEAFSVKQEVLAYVPEDSAAHYRMVPLFVEDDVLVVGVSNPDDLQMRDALNFISTKNNIPFRLVYMLDAEVTKIQQFYMEVFSLIKIKQDTNQRLKMPFFGLIKIIGNGLQFPIKEKRHHF